jgi:phospholipase A-2-activating protein
VKVPVYFQTINVDAAKNKINEFSNTPECSLSQEEQATLSEVYGQLKLPSVASLDSSFSENYNPATLLAIVGRWPEDKRFPREYSCLPKRGIEIPTYICSQ